MPSVETNAPVEAEINVTTEAPVEVEINVTTEAPVIGVQIDGYLKSEMFVVDIEYRLIRPSSVYDPPTYRWEMSATANEIADAVAHGKTITGHRITDSEGALLNGYVECLFSGIGNYPPVSATFKEITSTGITYYTVSGASKIATVNTVPFSSGGAAQDYSALSGEVADLKSAINVENVNLQMVAKPTGINLFDSKQLLKNGITVSDGVYSGTASAYANAHGVNTEGLVIFGGFESNQRYTLSFKARNASTTSQSGHGLYVYVQYTDNTTDMVVVDRKYTSFKALHLTSAANKTVKKYYFVVAQSPTIVWEIKEIQVEKGTTATSYEAFGLTAVNVAVNELRNDMNAELTALDGRKPDKISFELLDIESIPKSANLWNAENTEPGWINKSGIKVSGYDDTHKHFKIRGLSQGDVITSYYGSIPSAVAMRVVTAYNSSDEAVSASGAESVKTFTVPSGITSIIITEPNTAANYYFMVMKNAAAAPTEYYPYYEQHVDYLATYDFLKNIDLGVTDVEEPVYENTVVELTNTTGSVVANGTIHTDGSYSAYKYSQKLAVSEGDIITPISSTGENDLYFRYVCAYNGNSVVSSAGSNSTVYEYTVPVGIDGIIVSASSSKNINSISKKHNTGTVTRTFPLSQPLGKFNWKGSLSDGSKVELLSSNVRFDVVWNFTGHVTTMGKIIVGNKAGNTITELLSVDAANVYYKAPSGDVVAPHGLNISGDLTIRIDCDMRVNFIKSVTVTSLGETFTIAENTAYSREMYGSPYLESVGAVMTDCAFSWIPRNIDKPIWVFGDSWVSMYDTRWPYYMKEAGYTNSWMLNGFAGEKTKDGLLSFKNLLTIRKPDYLVWLYGMNDKDTNGVVNAKWKEAYDEIVSICNDYDITLILYTVPNTPTIDNNYKNAIVRASGYRYIDGAVAIGDDGNGNWFAGYEQSASDHNHTSAKGAKALFMRILTDFPEIAGNSL